MSQPSPLLYAAMEATLTVAGQEYQKKCPNFTLISRRDAVAKYLEFEIGNIQAPAAGVYSGLIQPGDEVSLTWGLEEDVVTVFSGTVRDVNDAKTVRVWATDAGANLLSARTVTNTRGETTSQIIQRLAAEAGLDPARVSTRFDVVWPHWVAAGETIQESLLKIKTALAEQWGRDVGSLRWWTDGENRFHWAPWADEANGRNVCRKELALANKVNIIELEAPKAGGELGRVLIHPWPYFDHSMMVAITDSTLAKVAGSYRIEEVRHIQRGFKARTVLYFREV